MAPRVEKAEVFKKGWNFPNENCFASCIMKFFFLLWTKETAFFLIFTMELFFTALSYLTAQLTLNFTWIKFNLKFNLNLIYLYIFKHKHKSNIKGAIFELRSSHLFRDQPYKEVLEVKCQACNFTGVLSFTSVFEDFGPIFLTCFSQNFS